MSDDNKKRYLTTMVMPWERYEISTEPGWDGTRIIVEIFNIEENK